MGYFSTKVGRAVLSTPPSDAKRPMLAPRLAGARFAAQVGKPLLGEKPAVADRCPRCTGVLAEEDGLFRCGGRCGRCWVMGGPGRWLDPAVLPFGACGCCQPRMALVAAEVGAICPGSRTEYLVLPEGVMARAVAAPLGVCRCCLPPQPLVETTVETMVETTVGLVCRNKPQQHYTLASGMGGEREVIWLGNAPVLDQAAITAAIDAALSANNAELTLFGLFASPNEW